MLQNNTSVALSPIRENKHSGRDYRGVLYNRIPGVDMVIVDHKYIVDAYDEWDPSHYNINASIAVEGYFQYLPTILPIIPMIRSDLINYIQTRRETLREKYRIRNLHTAGFIHVRRGDYLTAPPGYHWIQGEEYYVPALSKISSVTNWFVLSDDTAWCKLQPMFSTFEVVEEPDELDGLALMSLCHGGAIIANSTYSWWGAMLGASPAGAPVVYPSKWCQHHKPDLFPSEWIRI